MADSNGTVKLAGGTVKATDALKALIEGDAAARVAHYAANPTGRAHTPEGRKALRDLEKAKAALVLAIQAASSAPVANYREACTAVGYTPRYAPRNGA